MLKSGIESEGWYLLWKAELLQAISGIQEWSEGQWLFVLSGILTLGTKDNHSNTCSIRALAPILVKLLQSRVDFYSLQQMRGDDIDFWLHVMMTLVDVPASKSTTIIYPWITHARDIEGYGSGGNLRDPDHIRRLFQLSDDRGLDPSLMRECLVTILCILILHNPFGQRMLRPMGYPMQCPKQHLQRHHWLLSPNQLKSAWKTRLEDFWRSSQHFSR